MSLSLGVIAHSANDHLVQVTKKALRSYNAADELIAVENGGHADYEVDTYVRFTTNRGFTRAANAILKIASGDYIAVVNNDTYLVSGDLKDLCIPGTVTSPIPDIPAPEGFRGSFFVIPRELITKIGLLDEDLAHFESDVEYSQRIASLGVPFQEVKSVVFHHYGDLTSQQVTVPDWSQDADTFKKKYRDHTDHPHAK